MSEISRSSKSKFTKWCYDQHFDDVPFCPSNEDDTMNTCIKPDSAPLPWKVIERYDDLHEVNYCQILDHNGKTIVVHISDVSVAFNITHYANSHASLVEALEDALNLLERKAITVNDFWEMTEARKVVIPKAKAALAAAKGEK